MRDNKVVFDRLQNVATGLLKVDMSLLLAAPQHECNLLFIRLTHFYMSVQQSVKMRFLDALCPPAFLYAIFLAINLGFDIADAAFVTAAGKVVFGSIALLLLNWFCTAGLGVVSWFIVALPFVLTALATAVAQGIELDRMVMKQLTKA